MSLTAELSYEFHPANPAQRAVQALVASRPGAWFCSRTMPRLDTWVGRLSRGRTSVPRLLTALPVLEVTTTGRTSGRRRTTHVIGIPLGDSLALIGSNFGQPATPAWVLNLEADPHATATYRNRSVEVVAREAGATESDEVMRNAAALYRGYAAYRRRIGDSRRLRIFVLEEATPCTDAGSPGTGRRR